jgi:hypothetical protein
MSWLSLLTSSFDGCNEGTDVPLNAGHARSSNSGWVGFKAGFRERRRCLSRFGTCRTMLDATRMKPSVMLVYMGMAEGRRYDEVIVQNEVKGRCTARIAEA